MGAQAPRRPPADPLGPVDEEDHPRDGADRVLAHRAGPAARRAVAALRRAAHEGDGGPRRQRGVAAAPAAGGAASRRRAPACSCVTSDRGLAGAYSANVLKVGRGGDARGPRPRPRAGPLRRRARRAYGYFRFRGVPIARDWQGFSEVPIYEKAEEIGRTPDRRRSPSARSTSCSAPTPTSGRRSRCGRRASGSCRSPPRRSPAARARPSPEYLFEPEPEADPRRTCCRST